MPAFFLAKSEWIVTKISLKQIIEEVKMYAWGYIIQGDLYVFLQEQKYNGQ